jgi:glycosyltransferase involved in cell wall biosynthesis
MGGLSRMRILLAHDYYRSSSPSGEDAVFRNERALLEKNQNEVIPFERFNDDIDDSGLGKRVRVALEGAWSKPTYEELSDLVRRTRPDLVHFHNTFPLISPSAYAACQDNGVPVVQTLHNYRLVCAGALLTRNGHPCEDCLGTSLLPALRHRC